VKSLGSCADQCDCIPIGQQLSKPIASEEGNQLGLVDKIVAPQDLLTTARQWALDIAMGRKPWVSSLRRTDKLEPLGEARAIIKFAREQVKRTAPNMTHPLLCLDAIEEGVVSGGYAGALKVLSTLVLGWQLSFLDPLMCRRLEDSLVLLHLLTKGGQY
jgi:hypothetical protein